MGRYCTREEYAAYEPARITEQRLSTYGFYMVMFALGQPLDKPGPRGRRRELYEAASYPAQIAQVQPGTGDPFTQMVHFHTLDDDLQPNGDITLPMRDSYLHLDEHPLAINNQPVTGGYFSAYDEGTIPLEELKRTLTLAATPS